KRHLAEKLPVVVGIEGGPPAVFRLHGQQPGKTALGRGLLCCMVGGPQPAQRQHHHGGIVDIRVEFVGVFEGPAGWAFEYSNEFYPDIDDTAMVMLSLSRLRASDHAAQQAASKRGLAWLLAMQWKDGGWGALGCEDNWGVLSKGPFSVY